MIDICSFLNSRDVSAHLRKIGYEFTAPEAAFVVYWSDNATLDEKIVAWREIVETMADCSMEEHGCRKSAPSFHRFLLDFIDLQKRKVEQFFDSRGCVYSYSYFEGGFQDDGNVFSNVEDCIAYIKEDWSQDCWNEDDVPSKFRISKSLIDQPESCRHSELYLNREMEVVYAYASSTQGSEADDDLDLWFETMWFAFPTPFKRGDIVVDSRRPGRPPFVLCSLPTWGRADCIENGFDEGDRFAQRADWRLEHFKQSGDMTDMDSMGYFLSEAGDVYSDCSLCCYLDLEFFERELADSDRWAAVVSAHLKGEISFDETACFLRYLRADSEARKLRGIFDNRFAEKYCPDGVWKKIRREGK